MDYETDTLTSARNNRAASEKFYKQVMASRPLLLAPELPPMLHRSPSGAKRKIRQRAEERVSRPSPFLKTASNSPQNTNQQQNYRDLIDSGGYQSILPELEREPKSYSPSPVQRLTHNFSTSLSSLSSVENVSPPSTLAPPPPPPSKPTVEVHPMPVEVRQPERIEHIHKPSIDAKPPVPPKPAVPAKPKGLRLDHTNNTVNMTRSSSMTSLVSPISSTTSMFMNNLFATPSFTNLHSDLQAAYKNPHMDREEQAKWEERKHESLSSLERRIAHLEYEREVVERELSANDECAEEVIRAIALRDTLVANKLRRHLVSQKELLRLNAKLRCQLEKLQRHIDRNVDVVLEEKRVRRRLGDAAVLQETTSRRERELEMNMDRIVDEEGMRKWNAYKDLLHKLVLEIRQIEERLSDARMQHNALNNTRPC